MRMKEVIKKMFNYACLTASAMAAVASASSTAKADENAVLGKLRPMYKLEYALEETVEPPSALNQSIRTIEDFSENRLLGIPQKYANWYLADLLMVLVHEQGHFDEIYAQKRDPSMQIQLTPFWVNGNVNSWIEAENEKDRARTAAAGFVSAGNLAENIKREMLLGNITPQSMRFMSMLALASELNLPFYLMQHYAGTEPDEGLGDIENFTQNSGMTPETMAMSSGIHMLVNAPYIYHLAKNALGSSPTAPEKKDYFLSFRYNGDSYMITFHSDLNTIVEKLPKPRFMPMHGEN